MTNQPTEEKPDIHSDLDKQVMDDLLFLRNSFAHSHSVLEAGGADEFSVFLSLLRANPERGILRMLTPLAAELKVTIAAMAVRFFNQRKDLLHSVFLVESTGQALDYFLVPKDRKPSTRFELNDFLSAYLQTQFPDYVPVTFRLVSAELAEDIRNERGDVHPVAFA